MIGRKNRTWISNGLWAITLGLALAAAPAKAAPGDQLGGDDTGCAPTTSAGFGCAKKVLALLYKLRGGVVKCHVTLASQAFKTGMSTNGFSNAEDNCSVGPSNTSAKAKFDNKIDALEANGCDATVIANARAARDTLLGNQTVTGSLDALNGTFFCDATSTNLLDPGGDDAGYIPGSAGSFKCEVALAKTWVKLHQGLTRCHVKLAASVFKGTTFDEELCEEGIGLKGALDRYDTAVNKYISAGICPPCLTDPGPTNALDLGTSTVADADATLQNVYICPGP